MFNRSPYNPGLPEVPELPKLDAADTETLRLVGTLSKRMPSMPGGSLQDLYGTNYRAQAQAEEARNIGIANDVTKADVKRNEARARAKNRIAQKSAERSGKNAYQNQRRQVSSSKQREKGITRFVAREVLGVGPDLYR
mgnify:CR=1 FL=1